jgi:hypothetical protein
MMPEAETNIRVLLPSRRTPRLGDIFAMMISDDTYLFGRVVSTSATIGPMHDVILIYIYRIKSRESTPPQPNELRMDNLLLPPLMTNRLPWSRGYFMRVGNGPAGDAGLLTRHCFFSATRDRYYDEFGEELPGPIPPVGEWGLESYRTIDDKVSDALGLGRASDVSSKHQA